MFKRLKMRIMLTNMIIISVLMLASLGAIYFFTYDSTHDTIKWDLFSGLAEWKKVETNIALYEIDHMSPGFDERLIEAGLYNRIPWVLRKSIFKRYEIESGSETVLSTNNDYIGVIQHSVEKNLLIDSEIVIFEFAGKKWAGWTRESKGTIQYMFLDVSVKMAYLERLITTSAIVFSSMLVLVFFISLLLTKRAVKPVDMAFEKQKQFISDASHEIRTPLASIRANADLILNRRRKNLGSDVKWIEYIKEETERMTDLTDELLYLAELENKYKPNNSNVRFDLTSMVRQQILGVEAVAFEKNIKIISNLDKSVMMIGNREKIAQVVIILLNNAMKYTPDSGTVTVILNKIMNNACLSIENTGPGMQEEEINKVFDRFYRTDNARNSAGGSFGLGLSIAKAIVESHGGSLECKSSPEGPTEFIMKI